MRHAALITAYEREIPYFGTLLFTVSNIQPLSRKPLSLLIADLFTSARLRERTKDGENAAFMISLVYLVTIIFPASFLLF